MVQLLCNQVRHGVQQQQQWPCQGSRRLLKVAIVYQSAR
jgi:hypothetical protein